MTIHEQHIKTVCLLLDSLNERYNTTSDLKIRIVHDAQKRTLCAYEIEMRQNGDIYKHSSNDTDSLILFLINLMCGKLKDENI